VTIRAPHQLDLDALAQLAGSKERAEVRMLAAARGEDSMLVAAVGGIVVGAASIRWQNGCDPPNPWLYDRFPLYSSLHWSIPQRCDESLIDLGGSRYDEDVLSDIVWRLDAGGGIIALGGYGTATTGGLGNPIGPAETDVMLAQLYLTDDIVGEDFQCDLVILFCMMTRDHLAARRFDQMVMQSDFHG
jgi:hypothetical protein